MNTESELNEPAPRASKAPILLLILALLGAGGLATMWEAVFADVGVALLAILNAVRVQKMQF